MLDNNSESHDIPSVFSSENTATSTVTDSSQGTDSYDSAPQEANSTTPEDAVIPPEVDDDTRAVIKIYPGQLSFTADDVINRLREDPLLFDKGNNLAEIVFTDQGEVDVQLIDDIPSIKDLLGKKFRFVELKKGEWVNVNPPTDLCKIVLSRGKKRGLRPLRDIINAPYLRADASVVDEPGYDEVSQSYLTLLPGVEAKVPLIPSIDEVFRALEYVWYPIKEFPFVDDVSRSACLSSMMTAAVRRSLPVTPGALFTAPSAGSGKSLLAKIMGILLQGNATLSVLPQTEDEIRKRITASLRTANTAIIYDNVAGSLRSTVLEGLMTTPFYSDRLLGASNLVNMPNTAMVIITGNNVMVEDGLSRRFLLTVIDPAVDQPYLRKFDLNPEVYVRDNRVTMIKSLLTIVRGYLSSGAGRITNDGRLASFEEWDDWVRQTVCWLATLPGCPLKLDDPIKSIENNQNQDPEREYLIWVLSSWYSLYGNNPKITKDIVADIYGNGAGTANSNIQNGRITLLDAVSSAINHNSSQINPKKLGEWLNRMKGRVGGGFVLRNSPTKINGYTRWEVTTV